MNKNSKKNYSPFENEEALINFVETKIIRNTEKEITIICAGHFIILPDKDGELKVGVFEGEQDDHFEAAQSTIGIFPQYTWKIGCIILQLLKKTNQLGKLSLLVNDWQLVPKDDRRDSVMPNAFRSNFYKEFKELPPTYKKEFDSHHFDFKDDIYRTDKNEFYLREVGLRDRFVRKLKALFKKNRDIPVAECSLNLDDTGNIFFKRDNESPYNLIRNGQQTGCVGGVAQMMIDISNNLESSYNHINFINLIPHTCQDPVNTGSELCIAIMKENVPNLKLNILNFYFNGYGPAEVDDFYLLYGREVVCSEFKTKD